MTVLCLCSYFSPRDITIAECGFLSAFTLFLGVFERIIYKKAKKNITQNNSAVTIKKCTKKRDARAKLLIYYSFALLVAAVAVVLSPCDR